MAVVLYAHVLLLDKIFTALVMEGTSQPATAFTGPWKQTFFTDLFVTQNLDVKTELEQTRLSGRPLESLTRQEVLQVKYVLLREVDALEVRILHPYTRYRTLVSQIYLMEYCFFDSHFVRDKDNRLMINEDFTVKVIEHPQDIKKAFLRIYEDLTIIDNTNRRWMQRNYGVIFRSWGMVPFEPAEMARIKLTDDKHIRTLGHSGGEFFGELTFEPKGEDVVLAGKY